VLGLAMVIALLYFLLMELLLIDASRAFAEAQRYRSRVTAQMLAENGAELAAEQMVNRSGATEDEESPVGDCSGEYSRSGDPFSDGGAQFELRATGKSKGLAPATATLRLEGTIRRGRIGIDWSRYSQ
jgi:hypothetical protein